jgi:TolA-binding protein
MFQSIKAKTTVVMLAASLAMLSASMITAQSARTTLLPSQRSTPSNQPRAISSEAAQKALSRAHYYYNNDDITDEAARRYRQVMISYPRTQEAETARYYVGGYYHRKHYILQERGIKDRAALKSAEAGYLDYIRVYAKSPSPRWLSDAYFNLALISMQKGDEKRARGHLAALKDAANKDKTVYLYQVVWSTRPGSVIDTYVPAQSLATSAISLIDGNVPRQTSQAAPPVNFNDQIRWLTEWCRSHRA